MKKITLLLFSFLVAGCTNTKNPNPQNTTQTPTPTQANVFTTIKDAVTKNIVLKCDYQDEDGEKVTTYIQGKTVRFVGGDEKNKNLNGLIKDSKYYLWESGSIKGILLDMTKSSEEDSFKMGNTPIKNEEDVINVLESQKEKCSVSPMDASFFELPKEIIFDNSGW